MCERVYLSHDLRAGILYDVIMIVYPKINFLDVLKTADRDKRLSMLRNISPSQISAIARVAKCVASGKINPQKNVRVLRRNRHVIRSVPSDSDNFIRKKSLIKRHHSIVPVLLRTIYVIQTILDEISFD